MYLRGKGKLTTDFGLDDCYKFYAKTYSNTVDKHIYRNVCNEFNTEMLRKVVYDGQDFDLGSRLGFIRIRKFNNKLKVDKTTGKIKNKLKVDWGKTLAYWKKLYPDKTPEEIKLIENKPLIYHINDHTDQWVMKWHWDKITSNVKNQSAYRFEPNRTIKREAAKAWKEIPGLKNLYYE
jgi:hypothetical protein